MLGRFITGEVAPENTRDDYDQQGPASFFACADGFVYLYMTSRNHWMGLKKLMGQPEWLDAFDDDWLEFSVTPEKVATFQSGFAKWVAGLTKDAAAEEAQRLGVPLVPVKSAADLKNSPQYRHRGFFQHVTHPVLGAAAYPTVPYLMSASPARISSAAPTLGQHTAEIADSIETPRPAPTVKSAQLKPPKVSRGGPLEGVRVVELTKVWAGPYAGKLLAFLGAEVIKVETSGNPDEMRAYGGTDINHAPYFLSINAEVLSVELDLKSAAGTDRLRDLIAHSDIVINNLRPGAMERLGLGYQQLTSIKPDIISVSIKMWGNDGPLGYQTGYAPCFAALAGIASLVGYPGGPPLGTSMRYGDSTVGAAAAFAAVAALLHRDLTGEGQFVDVSAVETLSSMIGDCLLEQDLTGKQLVPEGNRHPDMSPHNCYPCSDGGLDQHCGGRRYAVAHTVRRPRCRRSRRRRALCRHARPARTHRRARPRPRPVHQEPRRRAAGAAAQVGRCAVQQERDIPRRDQRSIALGPRALSLRQRSSRRTTADSGGAVANVGCSGTDRARRSRPRRAQ